MTNTFKGLDLTDKVPEELWMDVPDIVQEARIKTIPRKRKAKWLSGEALQMAVKKKKRSERQMRKEKIHPFECSSKEQKGEIRKPSSVINAEK